MNCSTNQIAGNVLLSSKIILKLDRNTVHVFYFFSIISILKSPSSAAGIVDYINTRLSYEDE